MVSGGALFFKTLVLLFIRILFRQFRNPKNLHRSFSNSHASQFKFQRYPSLSQRSSEEDLLLLSDNNNNNNNNNNTLIFSVEGSLLKSSPLFPYFMLVAFEAGSLLRALILLLLYPFICLVGHEMGLKIMVMVSFFGIKKESFIVVGRAVLPKFFLEDVGLEGFEVLMRRRSSAGGKRLGVTDLPQVMVDSFLRDYLEIEFVVGREVKVFCGYFLGFMEERKQLVDVVLTSTLEEQKLAMMSCNFVGSFDDDRSLDHHHQFLSDHCKEIYLVSEGDKRNWQILPRERYPKPLIFHDGRLAFRPTPLATLAMFMWVPFGFTLAIIRILIGISFPYNMLIPILTFTGLRLNVINQPPNYNSVSKESIVEEIKSNNNNNIAKAKGSLYVCNHRTLLDPLYVSFGLKKPFTAVTYSLSRMSEFLAPIKTIRLKRDRDQDSKMMEKWLNRGDMIVCPEGTTCREPYLLRFSPLFAELSDDIVPVALDAHVSMFYGTTASGLKCMDPIFFLMNPSPIYTIQFLDKVCGASSSSSRRRRRRTNNSCGSAAGELDDDDEKYLKRFDVANYVQNQIGKALGFECTRLTRKDKYLILAGNEGIASTTSI